MISQEELKACTYNLLKERGVTVQDIADIVMMIQQPYIPDLTMSECVESVQAVLEKRETQNAIITGIELDRLAEQKKLSEPLQSIMTRDEALFGIDEILALSIVNLYGSIGFTNYGYIDKVKPGIIKNLDSKVDSHCNTFLDDLVGAVAAAAAGRIAHNTPNRVHHVVVEGQNMNVLVVIDMQHDFVDGSLGSPQAQAIVDNVRQKIASFDGPVIFTRDTHDTNYLESQEGRHLPVVHCVKDTIGWQIMESLITAVEKRNTIHPYFIIDKPNFGSSELVTRLQGMNAAEPIESITLVGVCTDVCVVSNAILLKAALPEVPIHVDAQCCAGVTEESHKAALLTMRQCQIEVANDL